MTTNRTMLIHFIASKSHVKYEIRYYRMILSYIKNRGHTIAYDWVEETHQLIEQKRFGEDPALWQEIDNANAAAVIRADAIIVEGTAKSFFAGIQVAQAVAHKKPILLLTRDTSALGVSGLTAPAGFIKSITYSLDTLESIVADFLAENTIDTKDLRFNFFLDRPTHNYLKWMSAKTGKTKAEIVRTLLRNEMNRLDQ